MVGFIFNKAIKKGKKVTVVFERLLSQVVVKEVF